MFIFLMGLLLGPAIGFGVVFIWAWLVPDTVLSGHNAPMSILLFWCLGSIAIWSWPFWRSKSRDLAKGPTDYDH
jgi:hypothetical protein